MLEMPGVLVRKNMPLNFQALIAVVPAIRV
jgi:hypothetical protein